MWPIDRLRPNDWNPNLMDAETMRLTRLSMEEEGFSDPIDADPTGLILDGEHRWLVARELGFTEIPVFVKERYGDDAVITTIRKDRTSGQPDIVKMADIVGDLVDEFGSDEVYRRLGYDRSDQDAMLELTRWDWAVYGTDGQDAVDAEAKQLVTWSVPLHPETTQKLDSAMPQFASMASASDHGDTDVGRFVALVARALEAAHNA